jgi:hypothetical protein
MKKLLFIMMLLCSIGSIAQIEVSENKTEDLYKARMGAIRLTKFDTEGEIHYGFYFRNAKYQHLVDYQYISFNDTTEVKEFFNLIIKAINENKEYTLTVGKQDIFISKGVYGSMAINNSMGYCYVSKKEAQAIIDSL